MNCNRLMQFLDQVTVVEQVCNQNSHLRLSFWYVTGLVCPAGTWSTPRSSSCNECPTGRWSHDGWRDTWATLVGWQTTDAKKNGPLRNPNFEPLSFWLGRFKFRRLVTAYHSNLPAAARHKLISHCVQFKDCEACPPGTFILEGNSTCQLLDSNSVKRCAAQPKKSTPSCIHSSDFRPCPHRYWSFEASVPRQNRYKD